MRVGKMIIYRK